MNETILGHFTIVEKVGEGGMGVVYKARDTRLGRMVAIKALPDSKTADADSKLRFAQEARTASALNHPNIITIYEIAEHEQRSYIVMEFVDGKPLSQLIPKRGMKMTEALRVAVQVADALAAAHRAGIVHRDLKPGNIIVDSHGLVKVLDFGLAKSVATVGVGASDDASTRTLATPLTEPGTVMGSAPYMSPEQAEGRPVDARSDIFSFGAVLYEMITGQRPFFGESPAAVMAAVLRSEPKPVSELSPTTPPEVERLIGRCLRKDIHKRSQNMSDVKLALEELRDDSESGKLLKPVSATLDGRPSHRQWLWPAITAALILAGGLGWIYRNRMAAAPIRAPELTRLSPDDGFSYSAPAISPDGKLVAYVSDRSGKPELWLQQVGGSVPIQLTHSQSGVVRAAFFPDGTRILYLTAASTIDTRAGQNTLETISTLGGEPQVLAAASIPYVITMPNFSISPDGRRIAYVEEKPAGGARLTIKSTNGEQEGSLHAWEDIQPRSVFYPVVRWTPDGRSLLSLGARPGAKTFGEWEWFLIPADGSKPVAIGAAERLRPLGFSSTVFTFPTALQGNRAFINGPIPLRGHVWSVKLIPGLWRIGGRPQQLTFGTEDEIANSISTGGLAAIQSAKLYAELYLMPLDSVTGQASGMTRRLTRDGRDKILVETVQPGGGDPRIAYFVAIQFTDGTATGEALDPESGRQSQITKLTTFAGAWPVSLDGRRIARSLDDGNSFSIRIGEVGSAADSARWLCHGCGLVRAFSPEGRFLLYDPGRPVRTNRERKASIHLLDVLSAKDQVWLEDATASIEFRGFMGQRSDWAVVTTRPPTAPATSARNVIVPWREEPVPRPEWVEVPATDPQFSSGSDLVYFFKGTQLQAVRFDAKTKRFDAPYEVSMIPGSQPVPKPDDSWAVRGPGIVFARREVKSSVWLMKIPD
jgi:serine/threonine protein kinase